MFLRETISLNVMLLWKIKEVLPQATGATYHSSCHFVIDTTVDINFLIKVLLEINILICKLIEGQIELYLRTFIVVNLLQLTIRYYSNNIWVALRINRMKTKEIYTLRILQTTPKTTKMITRTQSIKTTSFDHGDSITLNKKLFFYFFWNYFCSVRPFSYVHIII